MKRHTLAQACAGIGIACLFASSSALADPQVFADKSAVSFDTALDAPALQLRVTGPGGFIKEATFLRGEPVSLPISKASGWPDGQYRFELWPVLGMITRTDATMDRLPLGDASSVSGSFRMVDGELLAPNHRLVELRDITAKSRGNDSDDPTKDQVITDDLIVTGSACVGFDCVNGESFGFDTIRMKENNTRIKFEDTSSTAGFPTTDWQLTANDSASGGQNKFSIEDVTAARVPFTVEGSATTNSIYVDSTGRVGFRTSTPVLDLHVSTTNTPGIRLEQTNAGGFTAQTWDVAGNEANFFVRDVTGGSRLPFRIRPGAPTSSIDISAAGDVGFGGTPLSFPNHRNLTLRGASSGSTYEHADSAGVRKAFWVYNSSGNVSFGTVVGAGPLILNPEGGTGNVGIGATPTAKLDVNGDTLRLRSSRVPAAATDPCNTGDITWGTGFVYVCVATNTWKRSPLSTW